MGSQDLLKQYLKLELIVAFDIEDNHAFIFHGNHCAKIDYSLHDSTKTKLFLDHIPIIGMFPSLKGTEFENEIECSISYNAD